MLFSTVITYGTFDIFHIGHLNLLRRARALGDRLIVGVSSDGFNQAKGKSCIVPYEERSEIIASLSVVDTVFPEISWEQKISDILQYNVTTFVMGDDWKGKFDDLSSVCDVVYLTRTPGISSSARKVIIQEAGK